MGIGRFESGPSVIRLLDASIDRLLPADLQDNMNFKILGGKL